MKSSQLKKISVIFFFVLLVFLLSGCWDRREVNDLALVTAAGIDKKSDHVIELSVLVFIPKGSSSQQEMSGSPGGGSAQTLMRSAEGSTIADAMSKLQEKLPRHIFWGHCEVFIFDEEMAKEKISDQIDFILRHPQLRERSQLFVSYQKAKEILKLMPPLERDISEVLRELGNLEIGMNITTKDFSQMLTESGEGALPWIKILPPEEDTEKQQTIAFINGTAIFKENKMIGQIDDALTRGVLWLRNEVKLATITIKPKVEGGGYISMNLLRAKSKIIPKIENGKWKIVVKATAETDIIQNTTNLDMSSPDVVKPLEKLLNKDIKYKILESLSEVQKNLKTDIFGFSDAFNRKYPKVWAKQKYRWNDIYPEIEVSVDSNIKIHRFGMGTTFTKNPQKKVQIK
ncbi:MAG TPA: Ger(x)C family spore germination protein [Bacillales bacterium]|nr:Ger(x)C family spore germination protein [Bacillales bacterium]